MTSPGRRRRPQPPPDWPLPGRLASAARARYPLGLPLRLEPQHQQLLLDAAALDSDLEVAHADLHRLAPLFEEDLVALLEAVVSVQRREQLVLALGKGVRLIDIDFHFSLSSLRRPGEPLLPRGLVPCSVRRTLRFTQSDRNGCWPASRQPPTAGSADGFSAGTGLSPSRRPLRGP